MKTDIEQEERLYAERQAMFEGEVAILLDNGCTPTVSHELVKLRQRVAALEGANTAQHCEIQRLDNAMKSFVIGLERLVFHR